MRNLKKIMAVVLALSIVLTSMTAAFAADATATATATNAKAKTISDLKLLEGKDGDLMLGQQLKRDQAVKIILTMFGMADKALALTDADVDTALKGFDDAAQVKAAWSAKYYAYAISKNIIAGYTKDGKKITDYAGDLYGKQFAKMLLAAMGYTPDYAKAVAQLAEVKGSTVVDKNADASLTREQAVDYMFGALTAQTADGKATVVSNYVGTNADLKKVATDAKLFDTAATGSLSATSVTANTAKSFLVKFNRAVADADKVTFAVSRLTSPLTVTATWNTEKTEATLTSASNLAEATFTVSVLADTKEIAKESVVITAQKVAKIEFTSKSVAVKLDGNREGYVTYKVYDQYNNDITTSYLANSITFNSGAVSGAGSSVTGKNGLITLVPGAGGTSLIQFPNVAIVAYDTNSNVSATASLPTSTSVGTLSDFQFGAIDNLKLSEGDVTTTFYIPYTAKDMSGNDTTDYNLVKGGLILSTPGAIGDCLSVSLPNYVQVRVVQDPSDSRKAAIEAKAMPIIGNPLSMDMPVTITAMTYVGKSSQIQTTVTKQKSVASFTLVPPADVVAAGESPEIKFEAYDQAGNKMTRYADLITNNRVTISNMTATEKVDGSLKLTMNSIPGKGTQTISATVANTGKISILNINVQNAAVPSRISINPADVVNAMEVGATQGLKMGDDEEIIVYDQYDRKMSDDDINKNFNEAADVISNPTTGCAIIASRASNFVTISGAAIATSAAVKTFTIAANALNAGSDTVTFSLVQYDGATSKVLSTVAQTFAVIATSDITDYTVSAVTDTIYASAKRAEVGPLTARDSEYAANPKVYGKTNAGAKVLLANNPIVAASVGNTSDFVVSNGAGAYDSVKVAATKLLDPAKTTATSTITVTLFHNGKTSSFTTNVTSSTIAPVAVEPKTEGFSDDIATCSIAAINNMNLVKYLSNGALAPALSTYYFKVKDSYGKEVMDMGRFQVGRYHVKATNSDIDNIGTTYAGINVDTNGKLTVTTLGAIGVGDYFYVSGVTNNGLIKTVKFIMSNP